MKMLFLAAVAFGFASCTATKIKDCPEEKIINKMPGPGATTSEYYIYKGQRYEISAFDEAWLKTNCPYIKIQEVH